VGKRRGLETVLKAMSFFRKEEITLTLLGSASTNIKQYFYNLLESYSLKTDQLVFLDTISEEKIASIASMHHIGLASEFAHNQNRDLCLTNKLFMYLLAGNAIVATDTTAQTYFLEDNQGIGCLYEQEDAIDLSRVFKNYIDNPELLDIHRKNALQLGKDKYNWNIEKEKFLKNVEQVLAK
jgi:glycosyltransferase involved in cell wall biosynthesis